MPKIINNLNRRFYAMATFEDDSAEITLYGDVVETQPVDFWTGKPIEGNFIIQSEFISDLDNIIGAGVKKLLFRINSFGGDASVGLLIHNRLREFSQSGVEITCRVDGVAMSAGSIIMCAADHIIVHPSSLVMIHKCLSGVFGWYNADDFRSMASANDAWDDAMIPIYSRKTGLSDTVLRHMMSATTYMTGTEAKEKGFADELTEDEGVKVAASADRRSLFVSGRRVALAKGTTVPESIPIDEKVSTAEAEDIEQPADNGENETGGNPMPTNLEELRAENPELATQVEQDVRAAVSAENDAAVSSAIEAERRRISEIDAIAHLYDDDTVHEAKYDKPCSAQEMAYRAAMKAAKSGSAFMAGVAKDNKDSHANEVTGTSAKEDKTTPQTNAEKEAAGEAMAKKLRENQ
ncbi:MAG: Clp protease ClpP [Clostridia bacterium]|nr:Clp protease ClpP [Clostridia bacterium]